MNRLYYGDCLTIMEQELEKDSVDLIYLDPPFNSDKTYHAIYKDETGRPLPDQVEAFNDMWSLDVVREREIYELPVFLAEAGIDGNTVQFWQYWMNALRKTQPKLLAYLSYMVRRLVVMRGLLKETGSIYLHCDPTASHYLKVVMDGIFGHDNFLNEVVWKRTSAHNRARRFGPIHDVMLFYSAHGKHKWNKVYQPYDDDYIAKHYRHKDGLGRLHRRSDMTGPGERTGSSGSPWRGYDPTKAGRHWQLPPDSALPEWFERPAGYSDMSVQERLDILNAQGLIHWPEKGAVPSFIRYLAAMPGIPAQDVIVDITPLQGKGDKAERMGYPTQKPQALLERLIETSTDEGDVVMDPFCGCATTMEAAQKKKRKWIGIDIAFHAIKRVTRKRLKERCKLAEGVDFTITGVPRTPEGAKDLWRRDEYHFQKWAIEQVDGFVTKQRSGDRGIDGRLYFHVPGEKDLKSMVVEVKGGGVTLNDFRALRGVLERDEAQMAGLIIMEPFGDRKAANFAREAGEAGDYEAYGKLYPRLQILSIPEILEGTRFVTPEVVGRSMQDILPLPAQGAAG